MINITLVLNVIAVLAASLSVVLADTYALLALALAFASGVTVTISSRYAFGVASEKQ